MSECSGPQTLGVVGESKAGTCGKVFTSGVKTKFENPDEHGDGEVSFLKEIRIKYVILFLGLHVRASRVHGVPWHGGEVA